LFVISLNTLLLATLVEVIYHVDTLNNVYSA